MNILHPIKNKAVRNEMEQKRKNAEATKEEEQKKIFELQCRDCLFFWSCPCGYSHNNAACLAIKRPMQKVQEKDKA